MKTLDEVLEALHRKFSSNNDGDSLFSMNINVIRGAVEITVHDDTDGEGELCYSAHEGRYPEFRDCLRRCVEKMERGL